MVYKNKKLEKEFRIDKMILTTVWIAMIWLVAARIVSGVGGWIWAFTLLPGLLIGSLICTWLSGVFMQKVHEQRRAFSKSTRWCLVLASVSMVLWGCSIVEAGDIGEPVSILTKYSFDIISTSLSTVIAQVSALATFVALFVAVSLESDE